MKNNNILILIAIIFLGFLLSFLNVNSSLDYFQNISLFEPSVNTDDGFYGFLSSNSFALSYFLYLKLSYFILKFTLLPLVYSSLVAFLASIYIMYLVGKDYLSKNSSELCGLSCAFITATSAFLLSFATQIDVYAFVFLLSASLLYYSLKAFNNPSKGNITAISILSALLILAHSFAIIFVAFNICALIAFSTRKSKENNALNNTIAGLILLLPFVPFILKLFIHPMKTKYWFDPFEITKISDFFTNLFSPAGLSISGTSVDYVFSSFGYLIFVLVPTLIALGFIIKSFDNKRKANWYLLTVFICVFLTHIIAALFGKIEFLTIHLVELYPSLILLMAVGFSSLKLKPLKISLGTIFSCAVLFYIILNIIRPLGLI